MTTLQELRERHKKLVEEQTNKGSGGGDNNFAKFEMGDNLVRFLPGKKEALDFFVETASHAITGPDGKKIFYPCKKIQHEECPVCEFYFDLWKRHKALNLPKVRDDKGKEVQAKSKFGSLATEIKAKSKYTAIAVIRALVGKENESPVKFIGMAPQLFNKLMAAVSDPDYDEDGLSILSLEKGNDFNIKLTKKADFNNYEESSAKIKKSRAGTPQEVLAWMENKLDLQSLVKVGDYEEGRKLVQMLEATLNSVRTGTTPTPENESGDDNDSKFKKGLKV